MSADVTRPNTSPTAGKPITETSSGDHLPQHRPFEDVEFYRQALTLLNEGKVPYLVGGGFALYVHTSIARMTKDLDIFVVRDDVPRVLEVFSAAGYRTEMSFSHWLAKAFHGDDFVDIIFSSGNGCCAVDAQWFEHSIDAVMMGVPVRVCPPEEMIWQKAFIMERERYDGADIAHLVKNCGETFDWNRLLDRFGSNWPVLLSHLILFRFIYPDDQAVVPAWLMETLLDRLQQRDPSAAQQVCRGTLLSREQFGIDFKMPGYTDPRLIPLGTMSAEQIDKWTPQR